MSLSRSKSDYTIIATLFSEKDIEVCIAKKGTDVAKDFYILNRFTYNEKNKKIFKDFFDYYNSPQKTDNFIDFFTYDKSFYMIFNYFESESIITKYTKKLNVTPFDDRCFVLEKILIELDKLTAMPEYALPCITEPKKICIGNNNKLNIVYDFHDIFKYLENYNKNSIKSSNKRVIYKNIHDIIFTVLEMEATPYYNRAIKVVLGKTKNAVYQSIPQLIVDLKKAEKTSKHSSWMKYIQYQISLRQNLIKSITKKATLLAIVIGAGILIRNKIYSGLNAPSEPQAVTIGEITYTTDNSDDSTKEITSERKLATGGVADMSNVILSPGLDIGYDDYIVQYGDTISSICQSYYNKTDLVKAVATFNNLDENDKILPGTILKLPDKTDIALYISD